MNMNKLEAESEPVQSNKPNEIAQAPPAPDNQQAQEATAGGCLPRPCSALGICSPAPEPQPDDLVNCGTLSLGKADPDGQFRVKLIKKDVRTLINILKASIGDDKESAWGKAHEEVNNYLIKQNLPPLVPLS